MVLNRKNKLPTTLVYGAAMATLFTANDINAEIVDITWENGADEFSIAPIFNELTQAILVPLNIDQVIGQTDFSVQNTFFSDASGNRIINRDFVLINDAIIALARVSPGDSLDPNDFPQVNFNTPVGYAGFRTSNGNVGWFRIEIVGGDGLDRGTLVFGAGQFGTEGETLTVGATPVTPGDVNGDGSVDLLDVQPFVELILSGGFIESADLNADGVVDLLDVSPFIDVVLGN